MMELEIIFTDFKIEFYKAENITRIYQGNFLIIQMRDDKGGTSEIVIPLKTIKKMRLIIK